jgi:methyl-accepting chemotaxis protein
VRKRPPARRRPKQKLSFRHKLLALGITLIVCPLILFTAVVWHQNQQLREAAYKGCLRATEADLDHIAESVYHLCENSHDALERNVREKLHSAREILNNSGGIRMDSDEPLMWEARNQLTGAVSTISLPGVLAGRDWLGQIRGPQTPVAVVDSVEALTDADSTIFERMNPAGDMLRVATNVIGDDGQRAIGTYIPAVGANGKPDQAVSTVLRGETFVGRAFLANAWYMAAYEPLFDSDQKVTGMLYAGVAEKLATEPFERAIRNTRVGKAGYVFVVNSTVTNQGHYMVSKGGQHDGEDIWNIREMYRQAVTLGPGESATHRYWRRNPNGLPELMIAHLKYFKEWDWAIGVTMPEQELYEGVAAVDRISHSGLTLLIAIGVTAVMVSCGIWFFLASGLTRRMGGIIRQLVETSRAVSSFTTEVSSAGKELARQAYDQGVSHDSVTSSLGQIESVAQRSLEHSRELKRLTTQARGSAEEGAIEICQMSETIVQIQSAGRDVVKINQIIDEIAFQTNILALNAAVEAARAGEAGLGFRVVADEVRNLAHRCAEAAEETSEKIRKSMSAGEEGVSVVRRLAEKLEAITAATRQLDELSKSVTAASEQQSQGIAQVSSSASQLHRAMQSTAETARDGAKRAAQFGSQAQVLGSLAIELSEMFPTRA